MSEEVAVEAACRAGGIFRVRTPAELVELAQALLAPHRPRGPRVAIVGDGGGHGVVAADIASRAGLELPALSERLSGDVAGALPPTAVTGNPVDFAGGGEQDVGNFERVSRLLLGSGEVDAVVLTGYFGGYSEYGGEFVEREVEVAAALPRAVAECARPLVVHTMYWSSEPARSLRKAGVPVYRTIESALGALARLVEQAVVPETLRGVPGLPETSEAQPGAVPGYWRARELLSSAGIELVEARRVRSLDEARAAAGALGYPVVLKATALLHKSDAGGVAVGLGDEDELAAAFARMESIGDEWSVERMAPLAEGIELIAGVRRDVRFGPIALVGLGGVYAESFADVAVALAPLEEAQAEELLRSLRCAPLLLGARGRRPVDLAAAGRAAAALSRLAAARPEIEEIEINPLLATPDGAVALDARVVAGSSR